MYQHFYIIQFYTIIKESSKYRNKRLKTVIKLR